MWIGMGKPKSSSKNRSDADSVLRVLFFLQDPAIYYELGRNKNIQSMAGKGESDSGCIRIKSLLHWGLSNAQTHIDANPSSPPAGWQ